MVNQKFVRGLAAGCFGIHAYFKEDDNRTVLELMSANIVEPLFAAPKQTIQATTRTLEYVGSRSKSHLNAVKQMSLSLLDVKERDKTCGQ